MFANQVVNLWPVDASLNRRKGAKRPDDWLSPAGQCGHMACFSNYENVPAHANG
jgi:hypothetical protein